ncbi:X-domain of DnaJ-containing-domain-containing protein [Chlamydoabsidia padenii]|nr:X-domain of DnaJ-containing-domain-containing protein [Chlamydoabsidia padenii]
MSSSHTPVDTYYYDVLDIPTDADFLTIKKAFKKGAIKYHPDKNKEPDAEEKFKIISEAYQILGSTELRSKYDRYGRNDDLRPENDFIDPIVYFQRMYGGVAFRELIGELNIGHFLAQDQDAHTEEEKVQSLLQQMEQQQQERVNALVSALKDKLSYYIAERLGQTLPNNKEQPSIPFEKKVHQETIELIELAKMSYGNSLLLTIGRVYSIKAKEYLGIKRNGGLPGIIYTMKEKKYFTKELWRTVKSNMEAQKMAEQLCLAVEEDNKEDLEELDELFVQKSYQSLWQMIKFEIDATLRKVCQLVLNDKAVNAHERILRAEGLLLIGDIYTSTTNLSDSENAITRMK